MALGLRIRARQRLIPWVASLLLALAWFATAVPGTAQSTPSFPALSGRVVDQANLLPPQAEQALVQKLAALETDTGAQLVVVTLSSLQDREIEDYGYQLGRHWGIGQKEDDNGVLLIVAPNERRVRIEVGYGLEPVLTDALSSQIIQSRILPSFRTGAYDVGIANGVDAVVEQLRLDPEQARARAAAVQAPRAEFPIGPAMIMLLVFIFMFMGLIRSATGGGRRRRGGNGVAPILIWAAANALSSGRGGGFRGGGGFGSGGFGGGGGGFGGGGASGGW
jgi:uncharacterized protein